MTQSWPRWPPWQRNRPTRGMGRKPHFSLPIHIVHLSI
nr:MAG TPA: hypothetical protein [Caudoviricetes sp.]